MGAELRQVTDHPRGFQQFIRLIRGPEEEEQQKSRGVVFGVGACPLRGLPRILEPHGQTLLEMQPPVAEKPRDYDFFARGSRLPHLLERRLLDVQASALSPASQQDGRKAS